MDGCEPRGETEDVTSLAPDNSISESTGFAVSQILAVCNSTQIHGGSASIISRHEGHHAPRSV